MKRNRGKRKVDSKGKEKRKKYRLIMTGLVLNEIKTLKCENLIIHINFVIETKQY
jgi:hypothetical protein